MLDPTLTATEDILVALRAEYSPLAKVGALADALLFVDHSADAAGGLVIDRAFALALAEFGRDLNDAAARIVGWQVPWGLHQRKANRGGDHA